LANPELGTKAAVYKRLKANSDYKIHEAWMLDLLNDTVKRLAFQQELSHAELCELRGAAKALSNAIDRPTEIVDLWNKSNGDS